MIVEDDQMLVEIYQKKMTDAGFDVKVVTNGKNVQSEAAAWQPEIILLDIVLPDMDGFEILENLGKDDSTKNIRVYAFSNLGSGEDMERAKSLGAEGFITKSDYTPSELVDEIKRILRHPVDDDEIEKKKSPDGKLSDEPKVISKKKPNGHKVLIIEDEEVFIEMFGDKLKQEGFEVVSAKNGKWGIKEAEKGGFSCVLIDMMMPALDGYEAIKELRSSEKTKETPIIILSNSALESEVKKALDLGANAYYIKTQVTPGEVVEKIRELI